MRILRFILVAALSVSLCSLGCGGKQKKSDDKPTEKTTQKDDDASAEPSPEELANSPCGNPNWAKLPAGAPDDIKESAAARQSASEKPDDSDREDGKRDGETSSDSE